LKRTRRGKRKAKEKNAPLCETPEGGGVGGKKHVEKGGSRELVRKSEVCGASLGGKGGTT